MNDAGAPGPPLRRVDPGSRARRGAAGGRLPRRLRDRAGGSDRRRRRRATPDELAERGSRADARGDRGHARALPRADGPLLLERSLHESGAVDEVLERLERRLRVRGRHLAAHHRAAATTRTACCGARPASSPTSGPTSPTTRTSCARGYDRVINVLGRRPPRLHQADARRLGGARRRPGALRDRDHAAGQPAPRAASASQMSKRAGTFVTLDDLLDDIGVDAARWFLASAQPRHHARPRPRAGAQPVPGQPGLLRPVRARADRRDPAPRRARTRGRARSRRTCARAPSTCTRRRARS